MHPAETYSFKLRYLFQDKHSCQTMRRFCHDSPSTPTKWFSRQSTLLRPHTELYYWVMMGQPQYYLTSRKIQQSKNFPLESRSYIFIYRHICTSSCMYNPIIEETFSASISFTFFVITVIANMCHSCSGPFHFTR